MNNNRLNNKKKGLSGLTAAACGLLLLCGCSDFLEPKPLSFYDPTTTFTTEAGLQATMAAADKEQYPHLAEWCEHFECSR